MLTLAPSPKGTRLAFDKDDRVIVDRIAYRPIDVTEKGYVFVRLDGTGVAEEFSRAEMTRMVDLGRVQHDRGALCPAGTKARLEAPAEILALLPADQHRRAKRREAVVLAFLQLVASGAVKRTDQSIEKQRFGSSVLPLRYSRG